MSPASRAAQKRVRAIIEALGGQRALSREISARARIDYEKVSPPSVHNWIRRGSINARWFRVLLDIAAAREVPLTPETLIGIGEHVSASARNKPDAVRAHDSGRRN